MATILCANTIIVWEHDILVYTVKGVTSVITHSIDCRRLVIADDLARDVYTVKSISNSQVKIWIN